MHAWYIRRHLRRGFFLSFSVSPASRYDTMSSSTTIPNNSTSDSVFLFIRLYITYNTILVTLAAVCGNMIQALSSTIYFGYFRFFFFYFCRFFSSLSVALSTGRISRVLVKSVPAAPVNESTLFIEWRTPVVGFGESANFSKFRFTVVFTCHQIFAINV